MKATIRTQLNRLPKQGRLVILKEGDRYRADGSVAAPPVEKIEGQPIPVEVSKSDFIEQVHKQKAREKEYTESPLVGEKAKAEAARTKAAKRIAKNKAKGKKKG